MAVIWRQSLTDSENPVTRTASTLRWQGLEGFLLLLLSNKHWSYRRLHCDYGWLVFFFKLGLPCCTLATKTLPAKPQICLCLDIQIIVFLRVRKLSRGQKVTSLLSRLEFGDAGASFITASQVGFVSRYRSLCTILMGSQEPSSSLRTSSPPSLFQFPLNPRLAHRHSNKNRRRTLMSAFACPATSR